VANPHHAEKADRNISTRTLMRCSLIPSSSSFQEEWNVILLPFSLHDLQVNNSPSPVTNLIPNKEAAHSKPTTIIVLAA
jgi:hypothetical protein